MVYFIIILTLINCALSLCNMYFCAQMSKSNTDFLINLRIENDRFFKQVEDFKKQEEENDPDNFWRK